MTPPATDYLAYLAALASGARKMSEYERYVLDVWARRHGGAIDSVKGFARPASVDQFGNVTSWHYGFD